MAKSKTKDSKKAELATPVVKNAGVTKASQTPKAKSKELAKAAAQKISKKDKKKVVAEPSSSEESDSSEAESEAAASSSDSDSSEDEKPAKKAATNGKAKAVPAPAPADDDSEDSEDDSDDSEADSDDSDESSEDEKTSKPVAKANGSAKVAAAAEEASDSDSDSDEESDDEKPAATKAANGAVNVRKICSHHLHKRSTNTSEQKETDDSEEDSDDSDDSEESEEETKAAAPASKKRKAEEEIDATPKKTKADAADQGSTTLFAGSLSWGVDDDILYAAFQEFEGLVGARVVTDKMSGRSRGFGYVDFADSASATKAYEAMQGKEIEGRAINLDYASTSRSDANPQARANDRAKKHGDTVSPESDTLFVGNLPFEIDQDMVSEFFGEVAPVASVRLPTDP